MALATIRANVGRNSDPSVVPQSAINTPLAATMAALAQRSHTLRDPLSPPSTAIALLP